jgi:hypothetical protein
MKGVYVLDLESEAMFVMMAGSIQEAQLLSCGHLKELGVVQPTYEGSYHFYPIQNDETDVEAERRVYLTLVNRFGADAVWTRKECYHSFRRLGLMRAIYGTYPVGGILRDTCQDGATAFSASVPLSAIPPRISKKDSHTSSSGSIPEVEKEIQFSISLE